MKAPEILKEMKNILRGECCCGYITKAEMAIELNCLRDWLSNAGLGDSYFYDGYEFTYGPDEDDY